jgi:cyclopropane fatty-acyl-phospholipid synthase-like methyltransferase
MTYCKVCNSNANAIIKSKNTRIYSRCIKCGYISLDESFYLDAQDEKKHYDNHHNTMESIGYVEMFKKLISEFIAPLKGVKNALDFGCGEGGVLATLLQNDGIKCDKYDLFYFNDKSYKTKKYDLILSTEVFEHLSNPIDVLKELLGCLNDGGYLLLMSSFHPNDDEKFLKWYYIQDITHIGFFSMKTFEYIAKEFGLKVVRDNHKNIVLFQKLES